MSVFIGRRDELKKLEDLKFLGKPNLVVIKGRRRIGKSRLAKEFAKDKIFLSFSGIAPIENVTAQDQRDTFARQFCGLFQIPLVTFLDWSDVFAHLTRHLTTKPTVILLDEISWMGSKDPTFIPKLKNWWDLNLQEYKNLTLIFCGSVSTWIEENIINSTAFFGRISLYIDLPELSLNESYQFLREKGFQGSVYDVFKILSIVGGVPWYIEQIYPNQTAGENIKRLCFERDGVLVKEFDRIFYDLFLGKGNIYKEIIHKLAEGMKDLSAIRKALNYPTGSAMSHYVKDLMISGYVDQHYSWSLKTGKLGKQSLYRLSDNYLRFYIKYIEPNLPKISKGSYKNFSLSSLPGWESMMGFQVESLILRNRHLLLESLGIPLQDIVTDNPYIQKPTLRHRGCQIDYLIQTHTNNLFVCEFKFKTNVLKPSVVEEMREKIKRFAVPRGMGICPVLVHLGGVSESVYESRYFYRIIDLADFLGNDAK